MDGHKAWGSESNFNALIHTYILPGVSYTVQYDEPYGSGYITGVGLPASSTVIPSFYNYWDFSTDWISSMAGTGASCFVGEAFSAHFDTGLLQNQVNTILTYSQFNYIQFYAWRRGGGGNPNWGSDSGIAYVSSSWGFFTALNQQIHG